MNIRTSSLSIQGTKSLHSPMETLHLNTLILENEFLKIEFLPSLGGRLYSFYDKGKKKELLYRNPVLRFFEYEQGKSWFSGGIGFGLGTADISNRIITPTFFGRQDDAKQPSLRMYDYVHELGLCWQVDFHLSDAAACLYADVTIHNLTLAPVAFDWQLFINLPLGAAYYQCVNIHSDSPFSALSDREGDGFLLRTDYTSSTICTAAASDSPQRETLGPLTPYHAVEFHTRSETQQVPLLKPEHSYHFTLALYSFHTTAFPTAEQLSPNIAEAMLSATAEALVTPASLVSQRNALFSTPCSKLLHLGTGSGTYENMVRMSKGQPLLPQSCTFPVEALTEREYENLSNLL